MTTTDLLIRPAGSADLAAIIALYADDDLGNLRAEAASAPDQPYLDAFDAIDRDPNHVLAVATIGGDPRIIATLLLSFLPGLSRRGAWRAQIEAVRVASDLRGQGIGGRMIDWAVDRARARGCGLVQLTSDARRAEAHRFYERAGFVPSHVGFKLRLEER